MIRRSKPVQILEWGQGTNTTNQNWNVFGEGRIIRDVKPVDGAHRIIVIQVEGNLEKKNPGDDAIKIAQQGQGMTPTPGKWGEVAFGRLKSIDKSSKTVEVEVKVAVKIGN